MDYLAHLILGTWDIVCAIIVILFVIAALGGFKSSAKQPKYDEDYWEAERERELRQTPWYSDMEEYRYDHNGYYGDDEED